MRVVRVEREGPCYAWYPEDNTAEEAVLVWMAPADGAWAVYLEGLPGEPRRHDGLAEDAAHKLVGKLLA